MQKYYSIKQLQERLKEEKLPHSRSHLYNLRKWKFFEFPKINEWNVGMTEKELEDIVDIIRDRDEEVRSWGSAPKNGQ